MIEICTALVYLDLSFSNILDLSVLRPLIALKSLVMGGVRVNDFSQLKYLDTLELLSLRQCLGLQDLSDVCQLKTLRSLDIGYCRKVSSISPLKQLTRLEELVLDSSGLQLNEHVSESIVCVSCLPNLRMLNVSNTALSDHREKLIESMHIEALLESESRDNMFFRAAAENNIEFLRLYIGSGQDLEVRAGPDLSSYLVPLWLDKCDGSTPFVDCRCSDEVLRPTALHLAMIFNAIEAVEVLVYAGANTDSLVWFAEVKLVEGMLAYDEEKAIFNSEVKRIENPRHKLRLEIDARSLADRIFEGNFVRLVMGLKKEKILNWKEISKYSYHKLLAIIDGTIDEAPGLHSTGPSPSRSKNKTEENSHHAAAEKNVGDDENDDDDNDDGVDDNDDDDDDGDPLAELRAKMNSVKGKNMRIRTFPRFQGQCSWRDLGMVRKLSGKPINFIPSSGLQSNDKMQPVKLDLVGDGEKESENSICASCLGKKSYWLESARAAAQERQQRDLENFNALKLKPSLYRTAPPVDNELLTTSVLERKQKFFGYLEKQVERGNIIRDEILEGHEDELDHKEEEKKSEVKQEEGAYGEEEELEIILKRDEDDAPLYVASS